MTVKMGVVGLGNMGMEFCAMIDRNYRSELKAVCESVPERLEESAGRFGVDGYADYAEMIEKADLDAIYIALPDFAHREVTELAARAGLHILLEKPLATDTTDGEAMLDTVNDADVMAMVCFANRWNPPFVAAKRAIDAGEVGRIISCNIRLNDRIFVPTKMLSWAAESDSSWFLLSHALDIASWLNGREVKRIYATGVKKLLVGMGIDTYDSIQAAVIYDDDSQGIFEANWVLPEGAPRMYDFKLEMIGEKAAVQINTTDQMVRFITPEKYEYGDGLASEIAGQFLNPSAYMLESFLQTVQGETEPTATFEEGLENVRVLEALHRSLDTGQAVDVDAHQTHRRQGGQQKDNK